MHRKLAIAAVAAFGLSLAACSQTDEAATPVDENPTGLEVTNARLVLPPVKGNPAAVYFDVTNNGDRAIALRSADIADAKSAAMHNTMEYQGKMTMNDMGPLTVPKGQTVKFEPGGKHVMAMDLSPDLAAGGKTELTLTVAGGDKVSVEVPVQAAGDAR